MLPRRSFLQIVTGGIAVVPGLSALASRAAEYERMLNQQAAPVETLLDDWFLLVDRAGIDPAYVSDKMRSAFTAVGEVPPRDVAHCIAWRHALYIRRRL